MYNFIAGAFPCVWVNKRIISFLCPACNALVNFMPHPPTPGRPHTPGGDLTLLLVPTPGAIDSCPIH